MPSDQRFDHFYATISRKREGLLGNQLFQQSDALRPDWRLVLVHQATPKLQKITLEGSIVRILIFIVSAIYQESFSSYAQLETLSVKAANGDDYEAEFMFLEASYREDVDTRALRVHTTKYFGSYVIREDGCQCVLTKSCWRCQSFQNQKRS